MNEDNTYKSRREFLKTMALSGSVLALAGAPWLSVFGSTGKGADDKVRLAFIGTGSRGNYLLQNLFYVCDNLNIEVVALCDNYEPSLNIAIKTCADKGIKPTSYSNYKVMIEKEKLDGVFIATPLTSHASITVDCLTAGIHVFCEKAMARNLDDIKWMYDTQKETGKILQIGHQRLFNPIYLEGMQQIHDGKLGTIGQIRAYWHRNVDWRRPLPVGRPDLEKQINWRLYKEFSAGLLTELMTHQIQVANWALKASPVSVMGTGSIRFWNDGRDVDDNVALIFSYKDGTQCIYDSMTSNRKYGLEEQIMGNLGTIEFEVNKHYLETPPKAPGIQQLVNDIEHGIFDKINVGGVSWVPETATNFAGESIYKGKSKFDTALSLEGFVSFIRAGKAPKELLQEAYNASIWTILAEQAIDKGEKLTMPDKYII
jgi:predicted dehydrogenase